MDQAQPSLITNSPNGVISMLHATRTINCWERWPREAIGCTRIETVAQGQSWDSNSVHLPTLNLSHSRRLPLVNLQKPMRAPCTTAGWVKGDLLCFCALN